MKVYKEIHSYEAKVMWGLSWRQIAAVAVLIIVGGGLFAIIAVEMHYAGGASWEDATNSAMWVIFPVLIPVAAWGWWRPKGLKPEQYFGYLIRHFISRKVTLYDDTYRPSDPTSKRPDDTTPENSSAREGGATEPVSRRASRPAAKQHRAEVRAARRKARRQRKNPPSEHPARTTVKEGKARA